MGETRIEWCGTPLPDGTVHPGFTLNPWLGCTEVSEGCDSCYAKNTVEHRRHWTKWGKGEPRKRTAYWRTDPFKWDAEAKRLGARLKVFCASLADWADEEVDEKWRVELWADVILKCRNLDWLMVTKRVQKAKRFMRWLRGAFPLEWPGRYDATDDTPLPHVWMIATAENQPRFEQRVGSLLEIPAVVHGISYEPALGPLDLGGYVHDTSSFQDVDLDLIDWVIVGGESHQLAPARRFDLAWARSVIRQCRRSGTACFVKQLGSNVIDSGDLGEPQHYTGKAHDMSEWPEDLRVREWPQPRAVPR